jgi:hypothetical protein
LLFVLVQELEGLQPRGFQRRDIVLIHSAARRRNFSGARRGVAKAAD